MYYSSIEIVLQEIPGEITICFTISGCELQCKGCHSPYLWKKGSGELLTKQIFVEKLFKYKGMASAVLFMGGEWHPETLIKYLKIASEQGFKTCLYTGENSIHKSIKSELTWLKTGEWIESRGGLNSLRTNQKFTELKTGKVLNHLFIN